MAFAARHAGRVNDKGELSLLDPSAWRAAVARHKGRDVWVVVSRQTQTRSLPQNRYYWSVVVQMVAEYIGEGRDETHEYLKARFLKAREVELLDGQTLQFPPSTKRLTVEQMAEYIREIQTWAASFLGLSIPDPDAVEVTL